MKTLKALSRASLFTLLAVACASPAFGRARASGYCQQGGQTIQVLGYQSSAATPVQASYTGTGCNVLVLYSNGASGATGPSGSVAANGTAITLLSGNRFNANGQWTGLTITIAGSNYTISSCGSATSCTLTSSAGTQARAVYSMSSATPAAVFADNAGTVKSNPFTVSSTGYWFYYADNGSYANQYSGTAVANTFTNAALPLTDPASLEIIVTPEQFGATGDGVTNDSAACQAAANYLAVSGGVVSFGPKTYECNFTVGSSIWLRGSQSGVTTLQSYAGSNTDVIQGTHFSSLDGTPQQIPELRGDNFLKITDVTIDGNKANNSSGYCTRIWGFGMVWENVFCQNGASGGIVTEYSDASGYTASASNPKLGAGSGWFHNIQCYANAGNCWTFKGPNDAFINGWIASGDTGWFLATSSSTLSGTLNASGTAITSSAEFGTLQAGSAIKITGVIYTISTCASTSACTLMTSAGSQSGASWSAIVNTGAIDAVNNGNCYGEGIGCVQMGANATIQAMNADTLSDSPICLYEDPTDGISQMTGMTIAGCGTYGAFIGAGQGQLTGLVSRNTVGVILGAGVLGETVSVAGDTNGTGLEVVAEAGPNNITAVFGATAALNDITSGGTWSGSAVAHQVFVQITSTGTPDKFQWQLDGVYTGMWTTGVSITGSAQTLVTGLTVTFAATTGHANGTSWQIPISSAGSIAAASLQQLALVGLNTAGTFGQFNKYDNVYINGYTESGPLTPIVQISGLYGRETGQNILSITNQTTPTDLVRIEHTGANGDGHIDVLGTGALYLNNIPLTPVYYGGSIGPCAQGAGCPLYTIGSPGGGEVQIPAASSVPIGTSYFVVDLTSPAFNTANAGGGVAKGYVYSSGSAWIAY